MLDSSNENGVTRGSGDVFLDLGLVLSPEDRVKVVIAHEITRVIVAKGYTQVRAAQVIGTDQAKVSKISRGLLDGFSAERLIAYLLALGKDLHIDITDSPEPVGRMTFSAPRVALG